MRLTKFKSSSTTGSQDTRDGRRARCALLASRPAVLLGSLTLVLVTSISLAAAGAFAPLVHPSPPSPPTPPTPSITAHPGDLTNQASAHFSYVDAQSGVSFQCQLDGGSFVSCPTSGIGYSSLSERSHNFKVRAVAGSKTSSATSYTWSVDTTPPSASISSPLDGVRLAAADWGARCPAHASICGGARDASGVAGVQISIERSDGRWWGGSSFDQGSESFQTTALDSRGRTSASWGYALRLPADGLYTVHVRASDEASNRTAAGSQASSRFTIDTTPPPAPVITAHPQASTTSKSASFTFADTEHGVTLLCRRDGARFENCTSPTAFGSLSLGGHSFQVQARDGAGNTSVAASDSWTIVKEVKEAEGKPFTVTGNASGPLAPGLTRPLAITVANPNGVAITVTALSAGIAAGSSKPGCDGPSNLQLTQSNLSEAKPVTVPANGAVTLPTGTVSAPQVLMKDLPINQDACKGASFTFTYSGSAHS